MIFIIFKKEDNVGWLKCSGELQFIGCFHTHGPGYLSSGPIPQKMM